MTRERPRPRQSAGLQALPAAYWSQLHRVALPGGSVAPIDHVLVGLSGVYVIQHLPTLPEHPDRRDEAVATSAAWADVVRGLLPQRYHDRVQPVVCADHAHASATEVGGVLIASLETFEHIIRHAPLVLSTSEVSRVNAFLRARLHEVPSTPVPTGRVVCLFRRAAAAAAVAAAACTSVVVLAPESLELVGIPGLHR